MIKKIHIKATGVRAVMSFILALVIGLSVVGFYFAQSKIKTFASEVDSVLATANQDGNGGDNEQLQKEIDTYQTSANKASGIISPSLDYKNKITQDLNKYASNNGLVISNLSFANSDATATPLDPSLQANGISVNYATITIDNPIKFADLMQFLKSIESNTPKMQLTGINLSSVSTANKTVRIDPLTIEFYTR